MQEISPVILTEYFNYSRGQSLMRKDNLAHFMSADCEVSTSVFQQLVGEGMINRIIKTKKTLELKQLSKPDYITDVVFLHCA